MKLGMARAEITPPAGTRLVGFLTRPQASEGVLDELELRAFWLEHEQTSVCLVTADVIGFDEELAGMLRAAISERFGIPVEATFLVASHTHSGPATCASNNSIGGPPIPSVIEQIRSTMLTAIERSRKNLRPVTLSVGRSTLTGYAMNRRAPKEGGKATYGPNPDGIRDDEVTALTFRDAETKNVRAVLFHYTCHSTLMGENKISADWPGATRRHIEAAFPGAFAGFLSGCPGEIRPACVVLGGKSFRGGTPGDLAAFAKALGTEVARAVETSKPAGKECLASKCQVVQIPFADNVRTAPLNLTRLDLAEDVALYGIGGDTCVDYGLFVKALRPGKTSVPVGYTNGVIAYLCPARYYAEGGYEPNESWPYFGLPGPLSPKTEEIVRAALKEL